jgi:HAD superfamily phosphatase (TIGR01681 family)
MNELELPAGIEFAPYNQVFQQLLTPSSLLGRNASGLNVVLIRFEDWQKGNAAPEQVATELLAAVKAAAAHSSTPFLICVCPPSEAAAADPARVRTFACIEKNLEAEFTALSGVYWLGTTSLAAMYPVKDYYDKSGDELGHVPYTPVFFVALATVIARHFHALNRPAHKVIVLDCDQTLWSGVCAEDGPRGIRLDPARKALQEFMRAQHDAGMLLCLCSKNQETDVLDVFSHRLEMPLRREHFSACRLNWRPKSENLKSLAAELQLGLDSFVLVDDNPLECAEVEANCPEVLTLQLPENIDRVPQFLKHCWVFDHLKLTAEDRRRNQLYRQERKRELLAADQPVQLHHEAPNGGRPPTSPPELRRQNCFSQRPVRRLWSLRPDAL